MEKHKISDSALKMRELIDKAIKAGKITRREYDSITHLATEDNHIDTQEKVLLAQLHQLLEDQIVKFVMEEKVKTPYSFFYNQTSGKASFEVDTTIFTEEKAKDSLAVMGSFYSKDSDPIVEVLKKYAMQAIKIATKDDMSTNQIAQELSMYPGFFNINGNSGITLTNVEGVKFVDCNLEYIPYQPIK